MPRLSTATIAALLALASWHAPCLAQAGSYTLDDGGNWVRTDGPAEGSDEALMAELRTLIAEGHPGQASQRLTGWIREHKDTDNPYLARAYLLRGDARSALGNEYRALYDYEKVIREFPSSPEFITAVERELAIAIAYVHGMKRRSFGLRISGAERTGEHLLLLVDERMPFSQLGETAGIELGDYYIRKGDLELADVAYEMFLRFYPRSKHRMHALYGRVKASVGRFKGPKYDATMLTDAELLIDDFKAEYPAEAERRNMDGLLARIDESKAAQTLDKARWYLKRGDEPSARFLLRRVVRDHPTTNAARTALDELSERGWIRPDDRQAGASDAPGAGAPDTEDDS